jgi:hypothetical protein
MAAATHQWVARVQRARREKEASAFWQKQYGGGSGNPEAALQEILICVALAELVLLFLVGVPFLAAVLGSAAAARFWR